MKSRFAVLCLNVALLTITLPVNGGRPTGAQQQTGTQQQTGASVVRLAGLRQSVTIRRDERGVPYVEASNEDDLFFAQGYATAADRLWQMDLMRRMARGELSEIFGKATLEDDKRRRTYGFASVVEAMLPQIPAGPRAALEAYARGVNAYLASLDEQTLPPEFKLLRYRPRPWTIADSLVLGKNFAEVLSTTWQTDLMRAALADLPEEKRAALLPVTSPLDVLVVGSDAPSLKRSGRNRNVPARPRMSTEDARATLRALAELEEALRNSPVRAGLDVEGRAASNNWVVSGRRTASGKPLLANDPHLPPGAPSIWHMVHLSAPGLRVAGVTAPGAPGVIIGHNEQIAWGMTNLGPDVQDLYLEKFDPANARRYLTPAGWRDAQVRREEIKVRRGPLDAATDTVTLDVTVTRHGPVVFERNGARYALRWTALDPQAVDFLGFFKLNRARNWMEFREALRTYAGPTQNFVYADTAGHIGYYGAGRIPIRKSGDGSMPYDGSTDAGEWMGYIPFAELPQVFDPPSGVIVTANSRVVGTSYRHHLTSEWFAPVRARRIYDLLSVKPGLTADDFRAVLGDAYSLTGVTFAREVATVARESGLATQDDKWRETVRLFDGWDGMAVPDSRAAPLVSEMRQIFARKILDAALGPERAKQYSWANRITFLDRLVTERPREWLPAGFNSYAELLRAVHTEAREALRVRLGTDETQWTWARDSRVRFPHPLAPVPIFGQPFVIEPFPQRGSSSGNLATVNVGAGVSMRLIADPGDWDRTQQGIAPGESGLPSSPHWKDQLDDWRNTTPRAFPFTARAVAAAARQTTVLTP